ncbi:MAG: hypothetical protein ABIJ40_13080 [Bacteroidota bacterium]
MFKRSVVSITILVFSLFCESAVSQNQDPYQVLDAVKDKYKTVNDYSVQAAIKVDVSFLTVPEIKAKVFFKHPDKIHLDAKGFAMLPKQGFNFSQELLLKDNYNAIYVKEEVIEEVKTAVIKIIPDEDSSGVILSTLWIDLKESVIIKVETTTKDKGTFEIKFNYSSKKYPLPSTVEFLFNGGRDETAESADNERETNPRRIGRGLMKGNVTVNYSDYVINKGIDDSIFESE